MKEGARLSLRIDGEGIRKAVQEAVRQRKELVLVPDFQSNGHIARIGYFLHDKGVPPTYTPVITWIDKDQIVVDGKWDKNVSYAEIDVEYVTKEGRRESRTIRCNWFISPVVKKK